MRKHIITALVTAGLVIVPTATANAQPISPSPTHVTRTWHPTHAKQYRGKVWVKRTWNPRPSQVALTCDVVTTEVDGTRHCGLPYPR
jgi:hypothetical protein